MSPSEKSNQEQEELDSIHQDSYIECMEDDMNRKVQSVLVGFCTLFFGYSAPSAAGYNPQIVSMLKQIRQQSGTKALYLDAARIAEDAKQAEKALFDGKA